MRSKTRVEKFDGCMPRGREEPRCSCLSCSPEGYEITAEKCLVFSGQCMVYEWEADVCEKAV